MSSGSMSPPLPPSDAEGERGASHNHNPPGEEEDESQTDESPYPGDEILAAYLRDLATKVEANEIEESDKLDLLEAVKPFVHTGRAGSVDIKTLAYLFLGWYFINALGNEEDTPTAAASDSGASLSPSSSSSHSSPLASSEVD